MTTLQTIDVYLQPSQSFSLFKKLDSGEAWWLVQSGEDTQFDIVVDGAHTAHRLVLNRDGTWVVKSVVVV